MYQKTWCQFLLLFVLLCSAPGYAQQVEITWGDSISEKPFEKFIFLNSDPVSKATQWIAIIDNNAFLKVFDGNNLQIESKKLDLPIYNGVPSENVTYEDFLLLRNKVIFLMSYYDYEKNVRGKFIVQTSKDGLVDPIPVGIGEFTVPNKYTEAKAAISIAQDSTRILTSVDLYKQKGVKNSKRIINVLSTNLDKLYSQTFDYSEMRDIAKQSSALLLDNNNNLYSLDIRYLTLKRSKKIGSFYYSINQINILTGEKKNFSLQEISTKIIDNIGFTINKKEEIIISGFYRNIDNPSKLYNGSFFVPLKDQGVSNIKLSEFTKGELLSQNTEIKSVQYIAKEDGGVIILSEEKTQNRTRHHVYRGRGNVLIVNLNRNGELNYIKTVSKYQFDNENTINNSSFIKQFDESNNKLTLTYVNDTYDNHLSNTVIDGNGNSTETSIKLNSDRSNTTIYALFTSNISSNDYKVWGSFDFKNVVKLGEFKISDTSVKVPSPIATNEIRKTYKHLYAFRLGFLDSKNKSIIFSGLNLALVRSALKKSNGISIGLLGNNDSITNGISYGTFWQSLYRVNGLSISPLLTAVEDEINGVSIATISLAQNINGGYLGYLSFSSRFNGISLASVASIGDSLNGLIIGGVYVIAMSETKGLAASYLVVSKRFKGVGFSFLQASNLMEGFALSGSCLIRTDYSYSELSELNTKYQVKGVAIAGLGIITDHIRGLTISTVNVSKDQTGVTIGAVNVTKKLKGIQFGILNYAGNNPKPFKLLPFLNVNFNK